jgi:ribosome biogenesis GTPase A
MKEHHQKAVMMQQRQDAIRLLDMAGIDLDSDTAENLLRNAGRDEEVIRGVRELGKILSQKRNMILERMNGVGGGGDAGGNTAAAVASALEAEDSDDDDESSDDGDTSSDESSDDEDDMRPRADGGADDPAADYDNRVPDTDRIHLPVLEEIRNDPTENVDGILPTVSMVREAMARSLLPRKYRGSKYDSTNVYNASTPELLDKLVQQALTHVGKQSEMSSSASAASASISSNDSNLDEEKELAHFKKMSRENSMCICQRCYRLQQYGKVETSMLPGWSESDSLTPSRFEDLLKVIRTKNAVVLCILDIFDLRGSLIQNLLSIAGNNPIVFAVNKVDLLPKDASFVRIKSWIYSEIKRTFGFKTPKEASGEHEIRKKDDMFDRLQEINHNNHKRKESKEHEDEVLRLSDVHLVSCVNKRGMDELMHSIKNMATDHGNMVYIMGSANVGKSSFVNLLLDTKYSQFNPFKGVKASSFAKDRSRRDGIPKATVSPIPGTTLDFLKIKMHNGLTFVDTPGLINAYQMTSRLTPEELKQVIPKRQVVAVTFRVEEGKCVMIGGLATVQLTEVSTNHSVWWIAHLKFALVLRIYRVVHSSSQCLHPVRSQCA